MMIILFPKLGEAAVSDSESIREDERRSLIERQGWSVDTLAHLMEYFIESEDLGEAFDKYLNAVAEDENLMILS